MIEDLRIQGKRGPVEFYWGVRSRQDLYCLEQVSMWENEMGIRFTPVLSRPDLDWNGRSGWVHEAVLADFTDLTGFQVYASGPSGDDCRNSRDIS